MEENGEDTETRLRLVTTQKLMNDVEYNLGGADTAEVKQTFTSNALANAPQSQTLINQITGATQRLTGSADRAISDDLINAGLNASYLGSGMATCLLGNVGAMTNVAKLNFSAQGREVMVTKGDIGREVRMYRGQHGTLTQIKTAYNQLDKTVAFLDGTETDVYFEGPMYEKYNDNNDSGHTFTRYIRWTSLISKPKSAALLLRITTT